MTSRSHPGPGPVLLEARDVSKRFGGLAALSNLDLTVRAAEVVALVGDNGAGKSTLVKVISGIETPDDGEVYFAGEKVSLGNPQATAALGIQTVYQDLAICDTLDTVQNLFLGREVRGRWYTGRRLSRAAMESRAREVLGSLGATITDLSAPAGALSGGQRQSVAVCRSVLSDPRLVILDEPTAALGVAQRAQVLALIARLKERGCGVIVVSHDLADVQEVADRIVVLRLGRNTAEFERDMFTRNDLVAAITGIASPARAGGV